MERGVLVAVTGGSGALYAVRLLRALVEERIPVHLVCSPAGALVLERELDVPRADDRPRLEGLLPPGASVTVHDWRDLAAPVASGSFPVRAMVVVPCSMGTIGRLAAGLSGNLIERAADVSLKEGRPLVLVPRETPLGQIHLRNLLELSRAGAIILPAMPGFYHRPRTVEEVADHVVLKIMDRLGLPCERVKRWGVEPEPAE